MTDSPQEKTETGCCPRFNPEPWDEKEITWDNKLFAKDHVTSFFHIPLNFGGVMKRIMGKIDEAKAAPSPNDFILLSDEKSLWGADIYIAIKKEVPGAVMKEISGTFLTKVFEGPYGSMKKWMDEMQKYVESENREIKKLYFYYTTCPKCAKHYGKNYVVLVAKV